MKISLTEIKDAKRALEKLLPKTPLVLNEWLSKKYDCEVWLKLENMQPIGSFKIRGATNKISKLTKSEIKKGVLAVSAGNHAQGVAWAASKFNTTATIIMPETASITKIENTKQLGAKVILHGQTVEDAFSYAKDYIKKHGQIFIHPFQDKDVIAGQGTLGLEIIEDLKNFDFVIGSIGGGGLVTGLGLSLKLLKHKAKVVAAQATGANSMILSLDKKKMIKINSVDTFADGIRVKDASFDMFILLKEVVDLGYHLNDEQIALAVLDLMEKARVVAEGSGALPLAVLEKMYHENPAQLKNKKVVLIISGGNIDVNIIGRIIHRGLVNSGRHLRISIFAKDKPGTLNELTSIIAKAHGNILQVIHDHDHPDAKINETVIELTLETKGLEHSKELMSLLSDKFENIIFHNI